MMDFLNFAAKLVQNERNAKFLFLNSQFIINFAPKLIVSYGEETFSP